MEKVIALILYSEKDHHRFSRHVDTLPARSILYQLRADGNMQDRNMQDRLIPHTSFLIIELILWSDRSNPHNPSPIQNRETESFRQKTD